jgi:hypothetical protein
MEMNMNQKVQVAPDKDVMDNNPMKAAVEQAINQRLDKDAMSEIGASPLAEVEREPTFVKESGYDYWEKVAEAVKVCGALRSKQKSHFKKFKR